MKKPTEHLTSVKNPRIRNIIALQKPRERREQGVFVIEGIKEIEKALLARYELTSLFCCPGLVDEELVRSFSRNVSEVFTISIELFEKMTYRGNSGGMIATARIKEHNISDLRMKENPLFVVLEAVEKPGNLGAILRTADAAGVDAVIVCDPQTDLYNPNIIRSSLGCIFTVPVYAASSSEVINLLKSNGINIFCTSLEASVPYHTVDFTRPAAIIMGAESTGLTPLWTKQSSQNILIPMKGVADSLNVSTSAAIVVFEAVRQRGIGS